MPRSDNYDVRDWSEGRSVRRTHIFSTTDLELIDQIANYFQCSKSEALRTCIRFQSSYIGVLESRAKGQE